MIRSWFTWSPLILALSLVTASVSCGPSLEQQESLEACRTQCGLGVAQCFETRTCLDIDGQIILCEEECQAEHDACEQGCVTD